MTSVVNLDYDWRACGGTNRTRWRVWILIWRSVVNCRKEIDEIESCWIFVIHGRVSRRINISSRCKDWPFKKSFLIFNSRRILKIFEDVLLGSLLIIRGLAMGAWKKEELLFFMSMPRLTSFLQERVIFRSPFWLQLQSITIIPSDILTEDFIRENSKQVKKKKKKNRVKRG